MVIHIRRMAKTLAAISVTVGIFSIIFWRDLMSIVGIPASKVYDSKDIKVTISGELTLSWKGKVKLTGQVGSVLWNHPEHCSSSNLCLEWKDNAQLKIGGDENADENADIVCHHFHWRAVKETTALQDCFQMHPAHWYGGGEVVYQDWPLEEWNHALTPFLSGDMLLDAEGRKGYGSVVEPYWLSSRGVGIIVDSSTPLHVGITHGRLCLRSTYKGSKYQNYFHSPLKMDYTICVGENVKKVHDFMRKKYFSFPTAWPDERMFTSPVWSSWAQYKVFIDQPSIMDYAKNIRKNNFKDSQLEIDDGYQTAYGDFAFDPKKFPNPSRMVKDLHDMGFRVTLWVTPFANPESKAYVEGTKHGYWVKDDHGQPAIITWWNGEGVMLDFTNPKATEWYTGRLKALKEETGIDSFKFDAGETRFLIKDYQTQSRLINPCEYTTHYVNAVSSLGSQIEVRAAYKNQNQPIFVRLMDRLSTWGWEAGLKTLLTTAVTFGVLGYPYVLPDMIGGNGYDEGDFHSVALPERELFIRWLELNAFLPSMQYSVQPWQYDQEVVRIAQKWTTFHEEVIAPRVLKIVKEETVIDGSPIIRPLWWIAPEDKYATRIDCEFLVGSDMLVAPVLDKGRVARDVYLPAGKWTNPNGNILEGGRWYGGVSAPLEEILYYVKT
ncbi:Myogenesis-regulating glycosidase [Holothuria leucospilota]|uniref:Myogenesis-regulating glycosidase n=1 Tax=Holothuria leucospilota TaxID=206669 RepID=A0A9Q1H0T1_HOLLE|nr:Myogenesis-regulating glycosidase [Holothuria leucospilota]